jgi:hypothetical protein
MTADASQSWEATEEYRNAIDDHEEQKEPHYDLSTVTRFSKMSIKGVRHEPTRGVKGAKPRPRLAKMPRRPETTETAELGEEYLRKRNKILELKYKSESMLLAFDRGELIERDLVLKQLTFLLIAMRQKLLALPSKLAARFGPERFPCEMFDITTTFVAEALNEVALLPVKSTDPDWLEKTEDEG